MRLYVFNTGSIQLEKGFITAGKDMSVMLEIPVPAFLITHPKGNVLFDTGVSRECIDDPDRRWGEVAKIFVPKVNKGQDIVSQLEALGYCPDDIDIVINSHLHLDHAGNNECFPKARFLVQRDEIGRLTGPRSFSGQHTSGRILTIRSTMWRSMVTTMSLMTGQYNAFRHPGIRRVISPSL